MNAIKPNESLRFSMPEREYAAAPRQSRFAHGEIEAISALIDGFESAASICKKPTRKRETAADKRKTAADNREKTARKRELSDPRTFVRALLSAADKRA